MSDVIKLLTDAVANQIAAGEVVQRPASVVKELLENSLDSGATEITLTVKDGGTSLIRVVDNGKGMSETDARMCWERHATSKIRVAQDIYALHTFGFRGEALASIAAVAQVEMKTRRAQDELATYVRIEGTQLLEQNLIPAPIGTSISVKNLFFNIPARRNFLKSIAVESKHIYEEFQRQALAHPHVLFRFVNNGSETCNFQATTLLQRVSDVLGSKREYLQVHENTEIVQIGGYIGLPESAKKTRGDQYFFVNGRFIKSAYFAHAIQGAFEGLIEAGSFPLFVLFLQVDPGKLDVNVHPTKTEVKFEDERHIYNILKSAVRKALGEHIMQPDAELFGLGGIESFLRYPAELTGVDRPVGKNYPETPDSKRMMNPFTQDQRRPDTRYQDWTKILGPIDQSETRVSVSGGNALPLDLPETEPKVQDVFQLVNGFVVCRVNEELYVIEPRTAHERILFQSIRKGFEKKISSTQQLLFPRTMELAPVKLHVLLDLLEDFKTMGFDISHFGGNSIIINGLPPELHNTDEAAVIEGILSDYESTQGDLKIAKHDSLALSMARLCAHPAGKKLDPESMRALILQLFMLPPEEKYFSKKPAVVKIGTELLLDIFRKQRN